MLTLHVVGNKMKFRFSNKKKASANMWWIIIGAVIALVVMIILMAMFTDKSGSVANAIGECSANGGVCTEFDSCPLTSVKTSAFSCPQEKQDCCVGAPKREPCATGEAEDDGFCYRVGTEKKDGTPELLRRP